MKDKRIRTKREKINLLAFSDDLVMIMVKMTYMDQEKYIYTVP